MPLVFLFTDVNQYHLLADAQPQILFVPSGFTRGSWKVLFLATDYADSQPMRRSSSFNCFFSKNISHFFQSRVFHSFGSFFFDRFVSLNCVIEDTGNRRLKVKCRIKTAQAIYTLCG
jgi:hypothetical protein